MTYANSPALRLSNIALARQQVIEQGTGLSGPWVESWIERSWRRCLSLGHHPSQTVQFESVSRAHIHAVQEKNQPLLDAAQGELDRLSRAISGTRYFALLTDAQGVVIDTRGEIDHRDSRASSIARVGVNLAESHVGTTAIGAVLAEQQPIWLHRGEHFFNDNTAYSCAGAPLFNPQGECVGMLDLTGIDVPERPELQHLAAQSARSIENTWIQKLLPTLLLRLNWSGQTLGSDSDGLIGLDEDGQVMCANQTARQMTGMALHPSTHAADVFAMAWQALFDTSRDHAIEVPLWSGLHVHLQVDAQQAQVRKTLVPASQGLKAIENDLIRRAMQQTRGNVTDAARQLGISRATLYRRIALSKSGDK